MSTIPTPNDLDQQDSDANHKAGVELLQGALTRALEIRDYNPIIFGRYSEAVHNAVFREFEHQGWIVRVEREGDSSTTYRITRK